MTFPENHAIIIKLSDGSGKGSRSETARTLKRGKGKAEERTYEEEASESGS